MSDFHRASPEMAWLRLCRFTIESTETKTCYYSLNRELRWLWNSVYASPQETKRDSRRCTVHANLQNNRISKL